MKSLPIIFILGLLTGCTSLTSFKSLPKTDSDYQLAKTQLADKYPEITANELHWRGLSPEFPTEESLVKEMGEPSEVKRDWLGTIIGVGIGVAFQFQPITWAIYLAIIPDIPKIYYYKKGNYCIEAKVNKTAMSSYQNYMSYWDWKEATVPCK